MKYTLRTYGQTRYLVYKHKDGMEILDLSLAGLIETLKAYEDIYYDSAKREILR